MKAARLAMCLVLVGCLASCNQSGTTEATAPKPVKAISKSGLSITQVRTDRISLDPAKRESATIRFVISQPADVELSVYDGRNRLVRRISDKSLPAGEHALAWDGLDERQRPVPSEAYVYVITAIASNGERVVHDMTDVTGGEPIQVQDVRWDPVAGQVHYRLDKPARVNIRFGLQDGGPFLRTLIDWVPRLAGPQTEGWDGWDQSHVLSLGKHPMLQTSVNAYSLPDNTVFVGAPVSEIAFADLLDQPVRERQAPEHVKRMYYHPDQPLETRGDISTSLKLDGARKQDREGRWIVSGRVPVRLDVANEDRARVLERRFEPVFFVDGIYAFENEGGFLPMTWSWDTTTVNEGEHFITTNVRGYEGNFGTATLRVWVERSPDAPGAKPTKVLGSKQDG